MFCYRFEQQNFTNCSSTCHTSSSSRDRGNAAAACELLLGGEALRAATGAIARACGCFRVSARAGRLLRQVKLMGSFRVSARVQLSSCLQECCMLTRRRSLRPQMHVSSPATSQYSSSTCIYNAWTTVTEVLPPTCSRQVASYSTGGLIRQTPSLKPSTGARGCLT